MNFSFNDWIGQVTTGHGAMILGPTVLAAASGTMSWSTAVPLLTAGVVGLLWPENTALKSVSQTVALDVEALIAAYRTGMDHGATGELPDLAADTAAMPPHTGAAVSALAALVAGGLCLAACASQTPTQQAAVEKTIASGLLCVADTSGKVVTTATTSDPSAVKAVNAAIAAGQVLVTDSACQTALAGGAASVTGTASP